ncbi:MAG: 4Fe-4S dicluster domain-containing protein [Coriobacteriaceae bacterium]|jgi:molybdopterin-containing oxidoreductase family iron-sulfur binding subunit|nr:4Fe-4S dicluster domain-containing protein [Coriobacteriaceae bacterium]
MQYGMAIDQQTCIGCHTCAVACRVENNLPKNAWWNRVATDGGPQMDTPAGTFPLVTMHYLTIACQHCKNPACTRVCPVGATYKRAEDGVVFQDYDKCIGCRMCIAACPYTGVRSFNWDEPSYVIDFAVGDLDIARHQKHTVEKCTFCAHRLARGEEPACIKVCPARARHYGDLDDPTSEVSRLIASRKWHQLLPEEGTKPSVYYLV